MFASLIGFTTILAILGNSSAQSNPPSQLSGSGPAKVERSLHHWPSIVDFDLTEGLFKGRFTPAGTDTSTRATGSHALSLAYPWFSAAAGTSSDRQARRSEVIRRVQRRYGHLSRRQSGPSPLARTCPGGSYAINIQWSDGTASYLSLLENNVPYFSDRSELEDAEPFKFRRALPLVEGGPTPGPDSCTLAAPSLGADSITIAARQGEDADALQIPVIIPPQLYYQINDGVQAGILNQLICTLDRVSTDLACSSGGTRVYFLKETDDVNGGVGIIALGIYPDVADYDFDESEGTIVVSVGATATRLL